MQSLRHLLPGLLLFVANVHAGPQLADPSELYTGRQYHKAFVNPSDNPALPRVLLIGDSISIGYTVPVRRLLAGKANVHRIPTNGQTSTYGLKHLQQWLGKKKWDAIHFNWGLWDVCYRRAGAKTQGHRDKQHGTISTTPEQYRKNMEKLVAILKKTGAKLIWCSTSPVPDDEVGRIKGDEVKYNKIAREIMEKNGIAIDDLHGYALKYASKDHIKPGNVHYTKAGYRLLARQVANSILKALGKPSLPQKLSEKCCQPRHAEEIGL